MTKRVSQRRLSRQERKDVVKAASQNVFSTQIEGVGNHVEQRLTVMSERIDIMERRLATLERRMIGASFGAILLSEGAIYLIERFT